MSKIIMLANIIENLKWKDWKSLVEELKRRKSGRLQGKTKNFRHNRFTKIQEEKIKAINKELKKLPKPTSQRYYKIRMYTHTQIKQLDKQEILKRLNQQSSWIRWHRNKIQETRGLLIHSLKENKRLLEKEVI